MSPDPSFLSVPAIHPAVRPALRPLPALPPFPSHLPEDGTQGYTPYFYKMDEPVRVRRTISYGRGWQLLRSRGAGNEDEAREHLTTLRGLMQISALQAKRSAITFFQEAEALLATD